MWGHMERAMLFYKNSLTQPNQNLWLGGDVVSVLDVPYWFQLNLAGLFSTSGLPPMNSYIIFAFFNVMIMFPSYLIATAFFKGKKKPIVLTTLIFSLFAGFGWIYVLLLKLQSPGPLSTTQWYNILQLGIQKTAEDTYYSLGLFFLEFKTRTIGLICFFFLTLLNN